jgi:aspartate carbamoyltransferase regulatory subunit
MSGLEAFLPPYAVQAKTKPAQETIITDEECANPKCKKKIRQYDSRFTIREKGKDKIYCETCGRAKLKRRQKRADNED